MKEKEVHERPDQDHRKPMEKADNSGTDYQGAGMEPFKYRPVRVWDLSIEVRKRELQVRGGLSRHCGGTGNGGYTGRRILDGLTRRRSRQKRLGGAAA